MLSCKEVAERASALIDGELSAWERLRIRLHLAMCNGCSHFVAQMRMTDRLVRQIAEGGERPAPDAADARLAAILATLRRQRPRD